MNKTILITGASSGIGKVTAKLFQQKGWNVIATMRKPEDEIELNQLENILVIRLDVLDIESINNAVNKGIDKFGKIDVLLNNAGYGAYGPLEAFPRENIIRQFDTNVIGLLDVTRAVLPYMRENKTGTIINVSSIGGKMTFPLGSLYHGTKFAVEGISEALSFELKSIGLKVKIIEPGIINTDFSSRSFDFQNDTDLIQYQPVVSAVMQGFSQASQNSSEPELVAEVIFEAATDNNDILRYRAGADAHEYLNNREAVGDEVFVREMNTNFGF